MYPKLIAPLFLALAALTFSGCDTGRAQLEKKDSTMMGIATYSDADYSPTGPATIAISTDELYDRDNPSGKKVTLLWGLITIKDY